MTLLDDARRMASDCPIETDRGGRGECHYCAGGNYEDEYLSGSPTLPDVLHKPDCPWLSMPKIVAALESAERLIDGHDQPDNAWGVSISDPDWRALVASLRGDA